jgi:GH15 family glucan-1,4-alpha-glucosidase
MPLIALKEPVKQPYPRDNYRKAKSRNRNEKESYGGRDEEARLLGRLRLCQPLAQYPTSVAIGASSHTRTSGHHAGHSKSITLITLKALTYAPTGAIVAAVTTSLPERPGGTRNWDYRYCWLRDATFTLLAFLHLGYDEEAKAWGEWLHRAVAGSPRQVQILYGIGGERRLPELTIPWLSGYENSSPVRVGNAASEKLQIDIFGEIADAMFQGFRLGIRHPNAAKLCNQ